MQITSALLYRPAPLLYASHTYIFLLHLLCTFCLSVRFSIRRSLFFFSFPNTSLPQVLLSPLHYYHHPPSPVPSPILLLPLCSSFPSPSSSTPTTYLPSTIPSHRSVILLLVSPAHFPTVNTLPSSSPPSLLPPFFLLFNASLY